MVPTDGVDAGAGEPVGEAAAAPAVAAYPVVVPSVPSGLDPFAAAAAVVERNRGWNSAEFEDHPFVGATEGASAVVDPVTAADSDCAAPAAGFELLGLP